MVDQVFDWLLTLDSEILLVWRSKWNTTKVLYLLARYLPFTSFPIILSRKFYPRIYYATGVTWYYRFVRP